MLFICGRKGPCKARCSGTLHFVGVSPKQSQLDGKNCQVVTTASLQGWGCARAGSGVCSEVVLVEGPLRSRCRYIAVSSGDTTAVPKQHCAGLILMAWLRE